MKAQLIEQLVAARPVFQHDRLSRPQTERFLKGALGLLFPHFAECPNTEAAMLAAAGRVESDLTELLAAVSILGPEAQAIVTGFFEALPEVAGCLVRDAEFMFASDPAAESMDEVILAYPGFLAIAAYRIAHVLHGLAVPIVPRLVTEHAHERTGIDIHPGASIGCPFHIDHGTGIVIGETTEIGDRVKLYQGVTLGALSVSKRLAHTRRHPKLGDDVIVYASAVILGGDTEIGAGTVVGGNTWLTESVPANSVVYHKSEVRVRKPEETDDAIEFYI